MGLNISARVFLKVILEVVKCTRLKGIHLHIYLDDWLLKSVKAVLLGTYTIWALHLCNYLGILVNLLTLVTQPTQAIIYVGVDYQFKVGKAYVLDKRLEKMEQSIEQILKAGQATARKWSALIGHVGSIVRQVNLGSL